MPNESKDGNLDTTIAIIPLTRGLYATIDPDRRDYEGKAAAFSRPDGTLVWVKKIDGSFVGRGA
jgi:hypothetical protein